MARTLYIPNAASPTAAEAIAMKEGLALANQLGYNNVIAESDCTEIIEACSGETIWWDESSAIFADCIDLVSLIGNVTFKYCPREANEVVHELARVCFTDKNSSNWADTHPSFIVGKLINDVTLN